MAASHDAANTSTNESREACRNTPIRPFVSGSHLRESLGLRQERQMSFLRDECKHLVVVLGLSVDYSVTKRCSVASVGHMCFVGMQRSPGNTGDKRHNTGKHDSAMSLAQQRLSLWGTQPQLEDFCRFIPSVLWWRWGNGDYVAYKDRTAQRCLRLKPQLLFYPLADIKHLA